MSDTSAELSTSADSENEFADAGCWYSNALVVFVGRLVSVASVALASSCVATCEGVIVGALPNMFATTPATWGDAIDVPDLLEVALGLVIAAEMMWTPGAKMSTQEPLLEKPATASVESVAPTVMADASLDGE